MSKCEFCLSKEVCKYNDGHNLWCKGECPKYKNEYVYKSVFVSRMINFIILVPLEM